MFIKVKTYIYPRVSVKCENFYYNNPIPKDIGTSYSNFISSLKRK
jgi:hypothetical protein